MINNPQNFFDQVRNLCEELGLKMKAISESFASLLSKSDAESTYLKKTDAQSTYLGKTAKAESAKTADTATSATNATSALKATQDADGNVISGTYLKKTEKAASASTADSATKASQDGSGNNIEATYAKKSEIPEVDMSGLVSKSGNRGLLAGYETSGTATTINADSPDSNEANSDVTVANGSTGTAWTKVVRITSSVTVTLSPAWEWVGREAPTISVGGILVLCWCGNGGVANFVSLDA